MYANTCVCEVNYINYCVIYLTFEEKFGKLKGIDHGYFRLTVISSNVTY